MYCSLFVECSRYATTPALVAISEFQIGGLSAQLIQSSLQVAIPCLGDLSCGTVFVPARYVLCCLIESIDQVAYLHAKNNLNILAT